MGEKYNMDYVFGKEHRKAYMGLAMLWIIGYHFYLVQADFIDSYLYPFKLIFRNGFVGVDIFFFLSAYGLCCSWERSSVGSFYKKRFLRIIPLYLIFLILCKFILKAHHVLADGLLQMSSLSILNTSLTRTQEMGGEWFVPAIINLYLIFPFAYMGIKWTINRFPKCGVYAIVIGSIFVSGGATSFISPNYIMRLPIIVAGIMAFLYIQKGDKQKLLHVFVMMAVFYLLIERKNILLSVPLPLVLMALNEIKFSLDCRLLNFIGGMSFELYLSHVIPMNFVGDYNIIVAAIVMVISTVILAGVFHVVNHVVSKFR